MSGQVRDSGTVGGRRRGLAGKVPVGVFGGRRRGWEAGPQGHSAVEVPPETSARLFGLERNLLNDLISQSLTNTHCKPNWKNIIQEMATPKRLGE